MSYRPDGWRNPYGGYSEGMLEPTYEAGGDAMLAALVDGGFYTYAQHYPDIGDVHELPDESGYWVFIPDEDK